MSKSELLWYRRNAQFESFVVIVGCVSGFGTRLADQADEAARAGHHVSARGAYLRAAEYFRQAFFFHRDDLDSGELRGAYSSSVRAFRSALSHFDHPGRVLPTSGALSGYLFAPPSADGRLPVVMHIGGYDGTAEGSHDPSAEAEFDASLGSPALRALLAPRMATHGLTSVRAYFADLPRYTNVSTAAGGELSLPFEAAMESRMA
jgi:hypothetical protein